MLYSNLYKIEKNFKMTTVFRQSCAVFWKNLRICDLRINHENLQICYLRTGTPKKSADLRKVSLPTSACQWCSYYFCCVDVPAISYTLVLLSLAGAVAGGFPDIWCSSHLSVLLTTLLLLAPYRCCLSVMFLVFQLLLASLLLLTPLVMPKSLLLLRVRDVTCISAVTGLPSVATPLLLLTFLLICSWYSAVAGLPSVANALSNARVSAVVACP